jgi:hypothetical protein
MLRFDDGDAGTEQRLHNLLSPLAGAGRRGPRLPARQRLLETGITADVADAVRIAHDQNQLRPRSVEDEELTMQAKQED